MHVFQPFHMERMFSRLEKEVKYNLSESGVHPVLLRELVDRENGYLQSLLDTDLNYPTRMGYPSFGRTSRGSIKAEHRRTSW